MQGEFKSRADQPLERDTEGRPQPGFIRTIGVFCGSRCGNDPFYVLQSYAFGKWAAENGYRVAYGGGGVGTMGALRQGVKDAGGEFTTINLAAFEKNGTQGTNEGAVKQLVADTTHERTGMFVQESDILVALPGGFGTIEEIIDTLSAGDLSHHLDGKGFIPQLVIINSRNIHEGGKLWFESTAREGFTEINRLAKLLHFSDTMVEAQRFIEDRNAQPALLPSDLPQKHGNGASDYKSVLEQYGWVEGEGMPEGFEFQEEDFSLT